MSELFSLKLSAEEAHALFDIARWTIAKGFAGKGRPDDTEVPRPHPTGGMLLTPMGAFVTLHSQGNLRGCIGSMVAQAPLYLTVANMAYAAAFEDRRFSPLQPQEWPNISLDISVLGPMSLCPGWEHIVAGKHGVLMQLHGHSAVFLPQVATEQGWDVPTMLNQLSLKAGLPKTAWQDPATCFYWYEALVIGPVAAAETIS